MAHTLNGVWAFSLEDEIMAVQIFHKVRPNYAERMLWMASRYRMWVRLFENGQGGLTLL
jgi:hypothetical protein